VLAGTRNPFFVVGMPGSVHVLDLCLRFVPPDVDVILVSNAMEGWEQRWAATNLGVRSIVTVESGVAHGRVLDLLFDHFHAPFGILDYDCFVMNPSLFHRLMSLRPRAMVNALFRYRSPGLSVVFPETFVLFFNAGVMKSLRTKYGVSCMPVRFGDLSRKIRERLAVLGIDEQHMPEDYKAIFDTLRLIQALGMADGYECDFVSETSADAMPSNEAFHVGAVGQGHHVDVTSGWNLRGAYFWRRALECCGDDEVRRRYSDKYGNATASQLLVGSRFARRIGVEFRDLVERIVNKKSPPLRGARSTGTPPDDVP